MPELNRLFYTISAACVMQLDPDQRLMNSGKITSGFDVKTNYFILIINAGQDLLNLSLEPTNSMINTLGCFPNIRIITYQANPINFFLSVPINSQIYQFLVCGGNRTTGEAYVFEIKNIFLQTNNVTQITQPNTPTSVLEACGPETLHKYIFKMNVETVETSGLPLPPNLPSPSNSATPPNSPISPKSTSSCTIC